MLSFSAFPRVLVGGLPLVFQDKVIFVLEVCAEVIPRKKLLSLESLDSSDLD